MATSERTPLLVNSQLSGSYAAHFTPVASGWLYFSIISCVIGTSFSFGYSLGCVNTPAVVIQNVYKEWYSDAYDSSMPSSLVTLIWAFTVSAYCLGGLITGCFGGLLADRFGRKKALMVGNILQIASTLLMFSSKWIHRYEVIIVARLIYGFYGGIATVITPMYLNEIALPSLKGKVGTINQLMVVISLTLSQIFGLPQLLGTAERFYYLLALPVVTGVLHWLMFAFCPESPSWLYLFKKDKEGARAALEKLRRNSDLSFELDEYHKQEVQMTSAAQVSVTDMFTSYRTRPLIVACIMHCSQQLSGVNAVIFYSTSIFRTAGLAHNDAQYATLSLGGIMIFMTFVCMVLVDKLGRRTLHLSGLAGCIVSLSSLTVFLTVEKENPGLTWSCLCIASVGVFIISFNVGPGSIPWFYTSELFEPNSAQWAVSISIAVNWLCNFAVGVSFLHLQDWLQDIVFVPFLVLGLLFWIFLYARAPETKGTTVLEITQHYKTLYDMPNMLMRERLHYQVFHDVQT